MHASASIEPDAPSEWPIIDFVLLTGTLYAWSPNARFDRQAFLICHLVESMCRER